MSKTILIVDDAAFSRTLMRQSLVNAGFDDILEAASAKEAKQIFTEQSPDLTVLDIMLPDSTDFEFLKELLDLKENARIVINSALNKPEITREALLSGAKGFISKPFSESEFICKIRMALDD